MLFMTYEQYWLTVNKPPLKDARKLCRGYYHIYNNKLHKKVRIVQWDKASHLISRGQE